MRLSFSTALALICLVSLLIRSYSCKLSLAAEEGTRSSSEISPLLLLVNTCLAEYNFSEEQKVSHSYRAESHFYVIAKESAQV
jgi:hypothetical protein